MKAKVLFCRFPGGWSNVPQEHPDVTDWLVQTMLKAKADPRVETTFHYKVADTPVPMVRNRAVEFAKQVGADFVLMIDSDMSPDYLVGKEPDAYPFWDIAFNFMWKHHGPSMIAAPYCGPPPCENVYVFRWATRQSDHPDPDFRLDQFTREEAAVRKDIEQVAALPTGLCMFDIRALERLKPPYFYYEFKDDRETEKASTEDVTFTRDLSMAGVPVYCAWNCWAGHYKLKRVGKPHVLDPADVRRQFRETVLRSASQPDKVHESSYEEMDVLVPASANGSLGNDGAVFGRPGVVAEP